MYSNSNYVLGGGEKKIRWKNEKCMHIYRVWHNSIPQVTRAAWQPRATCGHGQMFTAVQVRAMYEDDLHCLYLRTESIAILRGAMSVVCKALAACIRVKSKEPCQAGQYWSVSKYI